MRAHVRLLTSKRPFRLEPIGERAAAEPWIAHMGILASRVDFSFSCCRVFDMAGAGFRRAESAVELMEARFSGGSWLSWGEVGFHLLVPGG